MAEYSDRDNALGHLRRGNSLRRVSDKGKGFFSDAEHSSPMGVRSESLSRGTLDHVQGHNRTAEHSDAPKPDFRDKARRQTRAHNLRPKGTNKTRFDA